MVNSEGGNQACRDHRTGYRRPDNGVAVVQQRIHTFGLAVAAERLAERARPVSLRGLGLKIVRIARANPASHRSEAAMTSGEMGEHGGLLNDLGPHDRLPGALANRRAGLDLRAVPFGLDVMRVERKHHSGGEMVAARDQYGCTGFQKRQKDGLRVGRPSVGRPSVVHDDHAEILDREGRLRQVGPFDHELAVRDGEPGAGRRKLDGLADHRRTSSVVRRTDSTDRIDRDLPATA